MSRNGRPHFEVILFDLDETLYPTESGLMKAIGERILLYMTQKLGIPADDANLKRREYYQRFGTSLRGLMEEYRINPDDFMAFVHNVNPADFFGASPPLNHMLHNIPLRKVIFTNADVPHSYRVLDTLQVRSHFEMIIDAKAINYKSKPDPLAYTRALELVETPGPNCIIIEDKSRNLIPAKDLGMTTILVGPPNSSPAVDYAVPTIFHAEEILSSLIPMGRV